MASGDSSKLHCHFQARCDRPSSSEWPSLRSRCACARFSPDTKHLAIAAISLIDTVNMHPFVYVLAAMPLLPYLSSGLRVEHLAIPALAGWAVLHARRVHVETLGLIGGIVVGCMATAVFSTRSFETGMMADPLSQFIRIVLPAFGFMALLVVLPQDAECSVLAAKALTITGALTAVFTAAALANGTAADLLPLWVQGGEGGTWLNSQDVGRFTGIFNQPIEAGVFYSVALISAVHVWRYSRFSRILLIICFVAIGFGGSASLSKNFIVLGAAGALSYAFMCRLVSRSIAIGLAIPILIASSLALDKLNLTYLTSLQDLYYQGGLVAALSAGRFGSEEGSVSILFDNLISSGDWITGKGLGSQLPLDNGFLEYFYQGGIVALVGYLVSIGILALIGWRHRHRADGKLLLVVSGYIWLASTGGPVLTANRAGVEIMLLAAACLIGIRKAVEVEAARASLGLSGHLRRPYL